ALRIAFFGMSIIALFLLPLNNNAVTFLFFILTILATSRVKTPKVMAKRTVWRRILLILFLACVYLPCVLIPFLADWEYREAVTSRNAWGTRSHLDSAIHLNRYQPYYVYYFIVSALASK